MPTLWIVAAAVAALDQVGSEIRAAAPLLREHASLDRERRRLGLLVWRLRAKLRSLRVALAPRGETLYEAPTPPSGYAEAVQALRALDLPSSRRGWA
jgi:hypothetical protein